MYGYSLLLNIYQLLMITIIPAGFSDFANRVNLEASQN